MAIDQWFMLVKPVADPVARVCRVGEAGKISPDEFNIDRFSRMVLTMYQRKRSEDGKQDKVNGAHFFWFDIIVLFPRCKAFKPPH
jgi:hypothetical protein